MRIETTGWKDLSSDLLWRWVLNTKAVSVLKREGNRGQQVDVERPLCANNE